MKATNQSASGTSFFNSTIKTTVGRLKELFPESYYEQNGGQDKVNYDFTLETEDGRVVTIYDWKEYRPIGDNEQIEFHIGGHDQSSTEQAREELLQML